MKECLAHTEVTFFPFQESGRKNGGKVIRNRKVWIVSCRLKFAPNLTNLNTSAFLHSISLSEPSSFFGIEYDHNKIKDRNRRTHLSTADRPAYHNTIQNYVLFLCCTSAVGQREQVTVIRLETKQSDFLVRVVVNSAVCILGKMFELMIS